MLTQVKNLIVKLKPLYPSAAVMKKVGLAAVLLAAIGAAFFLGRQGALSDCQAQTPASSIPEPNLSPVSATDYGQRVVAYIYGNVPITREELGEYLIARFGAERTEFLVNRRIVEMACKSRGVVITDAAIEAQLREDLNNFKINSVKDFENQVLRRFNKTLYEWKEDVIRPKLQLAALVRPTITVTAEDLQKAFEARYHEKVECRMIVLRKEDKNLWHGIWQKVAQSEKEFDTMARNQFVQPLSAQAGKVPPIHKHFGDDRIEKEVFTLKDGQVSQLLEMPDGTCVILKRDKLIPADTKAQMSDVRLTLHREITELKVALEVQKMFQRLRDEARPQVFLRPQPRQPDQERTTQMQTAPAPSNAPANNNVQPVDYTPRPTPPGGD
jgi:PPIC-type PPIASE domain